ncbi:MAG: transcriptional repressor [Pseudomonadota bacterium]
MRKQGHETQSEVLDIMLAKGAPLTAYEILDEMRVHNSKIAAPTIYRALAALTGDGRAHRIESTNSYVVCTHEGHHDSVVLAICGDCGGVEEQVDAAVKNHLETLAETNGFQPERHVIEVHGTCGQCAEKEVQ